MCRTSGASAAGARELIHALRDVGRDGPAAALGTVPVAPVAAIGRPREDRGELLGERARRIEHRVHRARLREVLEPRREHRGRSRLLPQHVDGQLRHARDRLQIHHLRLRARQRDERAGGERRRDERARRRVPVQQPDRRMTERVRVQQALREMREAFVQAEQFVALAHPLAVAVDEHENRRLAAAPDRREHALGERERAVDAERRAMRDTDHVERAPREHAVPGKQAGGVGRDVVPGRKQ
ncbi:hypothetical protein BURPS1710b_1586 [Burkholderia pseudomallei 1710b]|uniref:Uncharacterized protein n=1 Tax=Burkholderia pseudomallei (strain 1710b) TaxID=320372 RepID=Q3JTW3_BURP1|nr:hypothetical protein BURPS1710b_1586 [Burkholderia pseudomallei 1710b]